MKKIIAVLLISVALLTGCSEKVEFGSQSNNAGTYAVDLGDVDEVYIEVKEDVEAKEEIAEEEEIYIPSDNNSEIVEVTEKMFVAQMNDIYINADDYIGKTITYEGVMGSYYWEETDLTYYYVIRYGPGCCANDGEVGLETIYDGDYPDDDEWVRVVGVLEYYREDDYDYLILNLSSITVLDERGAETVLQ